MNGGLVTALVGMSLMAGAGGSYFYLHEFSTKTSERVVVEKPYVCTPRQAEAGECLPLIDKQAAPFGPVPNVTVNAIPAPAPAQADVAAPVPLPKARPKPVKKKGAATKLKSKWVAPPEPKPFNLKDLFNVR